MRFERPASFKFRKWLACLICPYLSDESSNLRKLNDDLISQLDALKTARPMTAQQWTDVERIMHEHTHQQREMNAVTTTLWSRFPADFPETREPVRGPNAALTWSETVIKYLRQSESVPVHKVNKKKG